MVDDDSVRNAGHDDWLDALEAGEGYYIKCENGHGLLPPRRVCPDCMNRNLSKEPLPNIGTVMAQTTIHVPAPSFQGDAPYTTIIADFTPVQITGLVTGIEESTAIENGATVTISIGKTSKGKRLVVFEEL